MAIYALIDTATNNILGEFGTQEEAAALRLRLVDAEPSVAADLVLREVEGANAPEVSASRVVVNAK